MKVKFTKMQGAGNDFVVLDETRAPLNLTAAQYRFLADRHFGVGADQILSVLASPGPGVDFAYKIHNNDGGEVEHCGNGARCFMTYVRQKGLTDKDLIQVQTVNRQLALRAQADGQVVVDMQAPVFDLARVPFVPPGLLSQGHDAAWEVFSLMVEARQKDRDEDTIVSVAVVSMGNPHAVLVVEDVDTAPVGSLGPRIQRHPSFPEGVNVGFMQILGRRNIRLRVYERGAGETLACGTGACAAVACGIRLGLLDAQVHVQTRGGVLTVAWAGSEADWSAPVLMSGPATLVFDAEIDVPDDFEDTLPRFAPA
jgi:diaminopimelate epimerase